MDRPMHRVAAAMGDGGGGEGRGRTLGAVIKEKDDELALFLEMRRRDKERGAAELLLSGGVQDGRRIQEGARRS